MYICYFLLRRNDKYHLFSFTHRPVPGPVCLLALLATVASVGTARALVLGRAGARCTRHVAVLISSHLM